MSSILRLRYLIVTSSVAGSYFLHQRYSDLQDTEWSLSRMKQNLQDEKIALLQRQTSTLARWAQSFQQSLESLTDLQERLRHFQNALPSSRLLLLGPSDHFDQDRFHFAQAYQNNAKGTNPQQSGKAAEQADINDQQEKVQQEMMSIQMKYQREIDRLEKELQSLKKQLLLAKDRSSSGKKYRQIKKSLIDMYSEVLDELNVYDKNYNVQDQLPRVIVIGDQSSGKTSVLEMITQARIFPRGAGEMMTRSPVKVTLSEGPYHVAMFKDGPKEFDLTKESDLAALRREIEIRMRASVREGQTISSDVISLSVKGPGLQRMVLVDLPGIISTETIGMAADTKNSIIKLANDYMMNPNAIILCIQDGSVDAERSNVTELVSRVDPHGKRTIFVLTKVDLAENNLHDKDRIRKILDGKLFPMKALGYFAVVTGKGNADDPIETIQKYEEEFFRNSKLFRDGIFKASQTTTRNLSFAVSDCFWKMVKESVEQQSDIFKARKFNLETEWKNSFPKIREQDRDELFEKARSDILDEMVSLSQVPSRHWEENLSKQLWSAMSDFIINDVFTNAVQAESLGGFNTIVDVKLRQWAEKELPRMCIDIGHRVLLDEFQNLVEREQKSPSHDPIANDLKLHVVQASRSRHQWDSKALDSLKVIQMPTLQDRNVPDKQQWEATVKFMENVLNQALAQEEAKLNPDGPKNSWKKYTGLQRSSPVEKARQQCVKELEKVLSSRQQLEQTNKTNPVPRSQLDQDELTTVKKNLQAQKIDASNEFILDTWERVFKINLLKKNLITCSECLRFFYYYQKGFSDQGLDCHEVVFFWRVKRMIDITSNALRNQICNIETRRLERELKDILDDVGADDALKKKLFHGKRVDLAEDLKRVRQIQEKLEQFVEALNTEK